MAEVETVALPDAAAEEAVVVDCAKAVLATKATAKSDFANIFVECVRWREDEDLEKESLTLG